MTKNDYLDQLSRMLHHLQKEDYDRALAYFDEYFMEAGTENEQQAIQDLGSPEEAARELIMNLAEKNAQDPPKTVKRSFSAIWIGILGVCAAPIAVPVAFSILVVILCMLFCALVFLLCIFISAVAVVASGVIGLFGGGVLLFHAFSDGLATIGLSLFALGLGILSTYGSFLLCKWALRKTSHSLGRITKGGRRNENNY